MFASSVLYTGKNPGWIRQKYMMDEYFSVFLFYQGTVIIIANHGERIDIPPGALLENKIVSGNLRILDHWDRQSTDLPREYNLY